jgi:hypothetical protein
MALDPVRAIASGNFRQRKGTALSQAQPESRPPLVRRPAFWLVVVAALLLIAVATIVGITLGAGRGTDASATDTPTPGTVATDAATATPPATETEAPPPAPAPVVEIPASCADIYTRDWSAELAPRVLNPAWTSDPASGFKRYGSNDVGLVTVLEATTRLECNWVPESGAGHVFLVTGIAELTPEQQGSTLDYLAGTDFECYDELVGTRCVIEGEDGGETWGESHFLRDGIWIATRWGGSGPDGYTHDIVAALFG